MDGSPSSSHHNNRDPILHRQDWELLSASALLTQSHILGLGLGLGLGREDGDGDGSSGPTARDSGNSVDEMNPSFLSFSGVYGRSCIPVDMSQISAMYNSSSTSASASVLEPFTEGWEPQFRIAGAPLQEDYYGREDPFVALDSNLGLQRHRHQNEPFLVMEQSFLAEPNSIVITEKEEEKTSSLRNSNSVRKHRESEEFGAEKGMNDEEEDDEEDEDEEEEEEEEEDDDDGEESMKECSFQVTKFTKSKVSSVFGEKISPWNQDKRLYQRSHIILSVAIAAALLGVFLYRKSNAS